MNFEMERHHSPEKGEYQNKIDIYRKGKACFQFGITSLILWVFETLIDQCIKELSSSGEYFYDVNMKIMQ